MSVQVVSALPGRLRIYVPGLVNNPQAASELTQRVQRWPGMVYAQASTRTGRVLILGEPSALRQLRTALWPEVALPGARRRVQRTTAAVARAQARTLAPQVALAGLLLAGLGFKRWVIGPSRWSQSWRTYDWAAVVTIIASYPFLRRGLASALARGKRGRNGDLMIGVAAVLALLLRENLLGLAVLFLHALTHERVMRALERAGLHQAPVHQDDSSAGQPLAAPATEQPAPAHPLEQEYERQLSVWGNRALLAGMLVGAATGQPRRALATMVAAAPAGSALAVSLPMAEALSLAPEAKQQAAHIARQNRAFAQAMNTAGLALAGAGLIQPLAATVWHNCTALGVLLNSMRLLTPTPALSSAFGPALSSASGPAPGPALPRPVTLAASPSRSPPHPAPGDGPSATA